MNNVQLLVCKLVKALLEKSEDCEGVSGSITTNEFKLTFDFSFNLEGIEDDTSK